MKISVVTRILTGIAALCMIAAIYLPIWRIELSAPQYPEGLAMNISADNLGGDVEIINGLNHYIGMKTLHADEFIEFTVLPYIIWGMVILGLVTAVLNRRKIFHIYFSIVVLFAVVAMVDFYRWEYNYGHNLDPTAPIQVPGASYQPPLIGYKKLLNFGAYSVPDKGGWMFIGAGVLLLTGFVIEWRAKRKEKRDGLSKSTAALAVLAIFPLLASCDSGPVPIKFGVDGCDHCKMTIMDKKFGGEIVTTKGKIYRFDDITCITEFIHKGTVPTANIGGIYIMDYAGSGQMILNVQAFFCEADTIRGPMGGHIAAFISKEECQSFINANSGKSITWTEIAK